MILSPYSGMTSIEVPVGFGAKQMSKSFGLSTDSILYEFFASSSSSTGGFISSAGFPPFGGGALPAAAFESSTGASSFFEILM